MLLWLGRKTEGRKKVGKEEEISQERKKHGMSETDREGGRRSFGMEGWVGSSPYSSINIYGFTSHLARDAILRSDAVLTPASSLFTAWETPGAPPTCPHHGPHQCYLSPVLSVFVIRASPSSSSSSYLPFLLFPPPQPTPPPSFSFLLLYNHNHHHPPSSSSSSLSSSSSIRCSLFSSTFLQGR